MYWIFAAETIQERAGHMTWSKITEYLLSEDVKDNLTTNGTVWNNIFEI
jgi:hypothetical protein